MIIDDESFHIDGVHYTFIGGYSAYGFGGPNDIYLLQDYETPVVKTITSAKWNSKINAYEVMDGKRKIYRKTSACVKFYLFKQLTKLLSEPKAQE